MSTATPHRLFPILGAGVAAAMLAGVPWVGCLAQERPGMQVSGNYPYAASVLSASPRAEQAGRKNLSEPVMTTISPDAQGTSAIALPERRSAIDHMLQSHEFTFGTKGRANFSSKQPPLGTNLDLDAIKLRVSRDKVLLKAEWSFN